MASDFLIVCLILIFSCAASDDKNSRCCNETNLIIDGCTVTDIVYMGDDRVRVWRSDGKVFDVGFSKVNLAPRYSIESNKKQLREQMPKFTIPGTVGKEDRNLSYTGAFDTKNNDQQVIVGYYKQPNGSSTDVVNTTVMAWNAAGDLLVEGWYLDSSATTSVTGLWKKNGNQLVLSVNSYGHMCFHYRSYNLLDLGIPGKADMFMPECIPANMLFGCPQSFCFTGQVDEVFESNRKTAPFSRKTNFIVRGMHWTYYYTANPDRRDLNVTFASNSGLLRDTAYAPPSFRNNRTFAAAFHVSTNLFLFDVYIMDDFDFGWKNTTCVTFNYRAGSINRYKEQTCGEMFGEVTESLDNLTAMYLDQDTSRLFYCTDREFDVPVQIRNKNGYFSFLKAENRSIITVNHDPVPDAIIELNGKLFYKSGQFIRNFTHDSKTMIPTIRHPKYNPNGIFSISHCEWSDDEAKDLITKINASGIGYKDLTAITSLPNHKVTARIIHVLIISLVWCMIFSVFYPLVMIMMSQKQASTRSKNLMPTNEMKTLDETTE